LTYGSTCLSLFLPPSLTPSSVFSRTPFLCFLSKSLLAYDCRGPALESRRRRSLGAPQPSWMLRTVRATLETRPEKLTMHVPDVAHARRPRPRPACARTAVAGVAESSARWQWAARAPAAAASSSGGRGARGPRWPSSPVCGDAGLVKPELVAVVDAAREPEVRGTLPSS
jgi:hypothetical protein